MIALQIKSAGKTHFVLRIYFNKNEKVRMLDRLWALLKKIRSKHIKQIINFFVTSTQKNRDFTIELIERRTTLTVNEISKNTATRVQTRGTSSSISTLDYFNSSEKIENFKTMD